MEFCEIYHSTCIIRSIRVMEDFQMLVNFARLHFELQAPLGISLYGSGIRSCSIIKRVIYMKEAISYLPRITGPIIVLLHVFVFFVLCRVSEGLKRMSLGVMYLGLFAVLEPWFSANILLSDEFQVCTC